MNEDPAAVHGRDSNHEPLKVSASANETVAPSNDLDGTSTPYTLDQHGIAPSLMEQRHLLWDGQYEIPQHGTPRTKGRKAFVGACKALSVLVPIDINDEATSMQESGLAKLANGVKRTSASLASGR